MDNDVREIHCLFPLFYTTFSDSAALDFDRNLAKVFGNVPKILIVVCRKNELDEPRRKDGPVNFIAEKINGLISVSEIRKPLARFFALICPKCIMLPLSVLFPST